MKTCENCGRQHEGALWETHVDGDGKEVTIKVCDQARYKDTD